MMEQRWARYTWVRLLLDLFLTILCLFVARLLRPLLPFGAPLTFHWTYLIPPIYLVVAAVWTALFLLLSVYENREQRVAEEVQTVFVATTLATLSLSALLYFSFRDVSRLLILTFYVLDVAALIGVRMAMRRALRTSGRPRFGPRRVLVLGAGPAGCDVVRMIQSHRWAGLEPVGFLDDGLPPRSMLEGLPVLGPIEDVSECVAAQRIDEVVVAFPLRDYDRFLRVIDALVTLPARVRIVPDHVKNTLFRTRVSEFAGVPMITLQKPALPAFDRAVKRAMDLTLGAVFLLLSLPLALVVAAAIRLDSPGPVLFRQRRVGENGRLFWMFKFRSMVKDAEKQQADLLRFTEDGLPTGKHPDDPRVTRVGGFIRRTSLDELPQFLNVLKGDMTMVGPRPELPFWVERYEPWQWQRLSVPQGMTGWWQVNGRSDRPMHLHTEDDLYYIQNYSLFLDIQIIWRTAAAVFNRQGAF